MSANIVVEVPEELQPLLPTFLHNRQHDVQALMQALADGDMAAIGRIGHNLKGVGGGYGFMQITAAGAQLEELARLQSLAGLDTCIRDLQHFLACVEVVYIT